VDILLVVAVVTVDLEEQLVQVVQVAEELAEQTILMAEAVLLTQVQVAAVAATLTE
jgi:hypothetical protein